MNSVLVLGQMVITLALTVVAAHAADDLAGAMLWDRLSLSPAEQAQRIDAVMPRYCWSVRHAHHDSSQLAASVARLCSLFHFLAVYPCSHVA